MMEVQEFIAKYNANHAEACDWLTKNTTSLKFNTIQDFSYLIQLFQEKQIQGGTKGPLLAKVVLGNADRIISLFSNIEEFNTLLKGDSNYMIRSILLKKVAPLLKTVKSLDQLFILAKKPEWYCIFLKNQEALLAISLLFKSWRDVLNYSEQTHYVPDLFKANPIHFASLFSNSDQIIEIYNKDPICASRLVRALGTEIAPLYSTTAQLQPLKLMDSDVADAIAKERNITLITRENCHNFSLFTSEPVVGAKPPQPAKKQAARQSNISLQILGGFIAVVGITTMALAFTMLSLGFMCLAFTGVGAVATLIGIGIFAAGKGSNKPESPAQTASLTV